MQVLDVIEGAGLELDTTKTLKERFLPFWEQAYKWRETAAGLVVTDESQTREMAMARQARLALREIRVNADKTRKALKEDSIRYGKAVQGVYNVIEYLIKPIENHLLEQEQFVEIQYQKRMEELNAERERIAGPLMEWINEDLPFNNTPWAHFTAERFAAIISDAQGGKKAHEEEQARLERERIAKEKEDKRIRDENAKLKAEAEQRECLAQKEREEAARMLASERAERERLEKEAMAKQEEERKAREEQEAAQRKAEQAPDQEKIKSWARKIEDAMLDAPDCSTPIYRQQVLVYIDALQDIINQLRN